MRERGDVPAVIFVWNFANVNVPSANKFDVRNLRNISRFLPLYLFTPSYHPHTTLSRDDVRSLY